MTTTDAKPVESPSRRQAFEANLQPFDFDLSRDEDGDYLSPEVRAMWAAWCVEVPAL